MNSSQSIRDIYPEHWLSVKRVLQSAEVDSAETTSEAILYTAMPQVKGISDRSTFHRIFKTELNYHLGPQYAPSQTTVNALADELYRFQLTSDYDPISWRWNGRFKWIGFLLLIVNVSYFLVDLFTSHGFSMGPVFMLIGSLIWLSPSLLGWYAFQRRLQSYIGPVQWILMFISIGLLLLFVYLLMNRVQEFQ